MAARRGSSVYSESMHGIVLALFDRAINDAAQRVVAQTLGQAIGRSIKSRVPKGRWRETVRDFTEGLSSALGVSIIVPTPDANDAPVRTVVEAEIIDEGKGRGT